MLHRRDAPQNPSGSGASNKCTVPDSHVHVLSVTHKAFIIPSQNILRVQDMNQEELWRAELATGEESRWSISCHVYRSLYTASADVELLLDSYQECNGVPCVRSRGGVARDGST